MTKKVRKVFKVEVKRITTYEVELVCETESEAKLRAEILVESVDVPHHLDDVEFEGEYCEAGKVEFVEDITDLYADLENKNFE